MLATNNSNVAIDEMVFIMNSDKIQINVTKD
jgi:hypothetical protein